MLSESAKDAIAQGSVLNPQFSVVKRDIVVAETMLNMQNSDQL